MSKSSFTLTSHFLFILDNFQNAYLTFKIHISAKWQPKIKTNISKSKSARSLVIQKYFNYENVCFAMHFTLDQTGVLFFWVTRYILCIRWSIHGSNEADHVETPLPPFRWSKITVKQRIEGRHWTLCIHPLQLLRLPHYFLILKIDVSAFIFFLP